VCVCVCFAVCVLCVCVVCVASVSVLCLWFVACCVWCMMCGVVCGLWCTVRHVCVFVCVCLYVCVCCAVLCRSPIQNGSNICDNSSRTTLEVDKRLPKSTKNQSDVLEAISVRKRREHRGAKCKILDFFGVFEGFKIGKKSAKVSSARRFSGYLKRRI